MNRLNGFSVRTIAITGSGCKEKIMQEREGAITVKGDPLTLLGEQVKVGDPAPDCEVLDNDLSPVRLSSYHGKVCIICSVPSLDTPVCDTETRKFNEQAGQLTEQVTVLTISMDLPFAQKRWCGAAGIENVQTLSDHRDAAFGAAYGVLIKELRLLARAVFVVDKAGTIRYIQLVRELTEEPDYDAALKAAKDLL
jgi:thiol peroxidase